MDKQGDKPKKVAGSKKKVGKYVVDTSNALGKGQFGQVYQAEHQQTKQLVAVKTITKKSFQNQDEYTKNALIREIQIMKNLQSPNIIKFVEIVETSNNIYIFQQIASDGTLGKLIETKGFLKQSQAIGYIIQLLTGFKQLINHGIIHRDIKPTNILVKNNVLKIADFGMSRYSGKFSVMVSFVGTPYYMAPQILAQQKYTYKCDIWSLGVMFYQLVTGEIPWRPMNSSNYQILYKKIQSICHDGIKFPQKFNISPQYKDLVIGCLKFDQADRFNWDQIYNHKLFGGKFQSASNTNMDSFTITQLRKKIHSNNINVQKLASKLPQKLTKQQFLDLLKALNDEITQKQSLNLYQIFSKGKDTILRQSILQFLSDYGINTSGLKGKVVDGAQMKNQKVKQLLHQLAKNIQQKDIDLFELYKKFDKKKQNKLQFEEFKDLVKSIRSETTNEQAQEIFSFFNIHNTPSIGFEHFYDSFCKAVQVPAVKDQKISQGIKKMEERKKGT